MELLSRHPDKVYVHTLLEIIRSGVKIGYTGPPQKIIGPNLPTANDAPDILTQDLDKQIAHNRVTKLDTIPDAFISSPLGLEPKPDGGWRRIHHLSYPRGSSVNCHIPRDYGALEYTSIDDAIAILLRLGKGTIMVKRDLSDAFRHIPIAPSDWWLLGFFWNDAYWYDRFLPFGLRTAPYIFDLFAKALCWMLLIAGWLVLHYLDDFITFLPPGVDPTPYENYFDFLCKTLGISNNKKKKKRGQVVVFLEIELDSLLMEARLPADKLDKAKLWVARMLSHDVIEYDDLQSLTGFLSFAAKVVRPGRAFLRRLFDALANRRRHIRVSPQMKADLQWLHYFLPQWNGISLLKNPAKKPLIRMWTDALGNFGMGGYYLASNELLGPD